MKRPNLRQGENWIHHDNAPAHRSFLVSEFLAKKKKLPGLPPYSPDLASADFLGRWFASASDVKIHATSDLREVTKDGSRKCFRQWYESWQSGVSSSGMGLFIDCHFLFQAQLLCLSLHIEVLSFEGSEWSRDRLKMECQVAIFEHF